MFNLFTSPRRLPTRLLFATCVIAGLSWLALWSFRQPVSPGSAPASNRSAVALHDQKQSHTLATMPLPLKGADAINHLEQTDEGRSLAAAMTVSRFGLQWQARAPFGDDVHGGGYLGISHDQNLNAWFGDEGVTIRPTVSNDKSDHDWYMHLRLKGYGYGKKLVAAPPVVSRQVEGTRIEYERSNCQAPIAGDRLEHTKRSLLSSQQSSSERSLNPQFAADKRSPLAIGNRQSAITEWYENRASGIEQGFTIAERPDRDGEVTGNEPLRVSLSLSGDLRAQLKDEGREIELIDESSKRVLSYRKLLARDVGGCELTARMETDADGREIVLVVDDQNASYPIVIDPEVVQQIKLTATDGASLDQFGARVAINGDTIVVGANRDDIDGKEDQGAVYVFVRHGATWDEQRKLTASDGKAKDQFGAAVDVSGNTIVVGARYADTDLTNFDSREGKAYVFTRSGPTDTVWVEQRLLANQGEDNSAIGARFGYSTAIDGDTMIIGAPFQDVGHAGLRIQGAAYIFVRNGPLWIQQKKLVGNLPESGVGQFGFSVGISGSTVIVGAPGDRIHDDDIFFGLRFGAAYVFVGAGAEWTLQQRIILSAGPADGDNFGTCVAIDGDRAAIGVPDREVGTRVDQGIGQVFVRSGGSWMLEFSTSVGNPGDSFGANVAISGDRVIFGSQFTEVAGRAVQGAAYLFSRQAGPDFTIWEQGDTLTPDDGIAGDQFAVSLDLDKQRIVIGSLYADGHTPAQQTTGAVYIFQSPDVDGDGLPDDWERNGITVDALGRFVGLGDIVGRGTFINLPFMGADPKHKDMFIHADWMPANSSGRVLKPSARAIKMIIDAFKAAPVTNPDGKNGVRLHLDVGPDSIMNPVTGETWGARNLSRAGQVAFQEQTGAALPDGGYDWSDLDSLKATRFDLARRNSIFRYVLFCNRIRWTYVLLGLTRDVPGTDLMVALGEFNKPATPLQTATHLMHELGHSLGLHHGGLDHVDFKPNYLSVMNDRFVMTGLFSPNGKQRKLDYSRVELLALDETKLNEFEGINDPTRHLTRWNPLSRPTSPSGNNKCVSNLDGYWKIFLPGKELDWNCDGLKTPGLVPADLNSDGMCVGQGPGRSVLDTNVLGGDDIIVTAPRGSLVTAGPNRICETVAMGADQQLKGVGVEEGTPILTGFNDWPTLMYDGGGRIGRSGIVDAPPGRATSIKAAQGSSVAQSVNEPVEEISYDRIVEDIPQSLLNEDEFAPADTVTYTPSEGEAPLLVTFDGRASTAVNGTIVDWSWDFGDGTTAAGALVTHTYVGPGEYEATLTVTDSSGRVNLVPQLNTVTVSGGPPTSTSDFYTKKTGAWTDPCTWHLPASNGNCGTTYPDQSDSVEIFHTVAVETGGACQSLKLDGSITGPGLVLVSGDLEVLGGGIDAKLTVSGNTTVTGNSRLSGLLTAKAITVDGTLGGPGVIVVNGTGANATLFTNHGSVSVGRVEVGNINEAFNYAIAGGGPWALSQGLQLNARNSLELMGTVPMHAGYLTVAPGSSLLISGALTFGGGQIANVGTTLIRGSLDFTGTTIGNAGLLDIGSTTLNFRGTVEFGNAVVGTVAGTGEIRFAPSDDSAILSVNGVIAPAVRIASGTIEYRSGLSSTNTGGVSGPFTVDAGATFAMTASGFYMHNDVTINGAVTKVGIPSDTAILIFNGSTFTNNGSIGNIDFFQFNSTETPRSQVITGTGSWAARNIDVGGPPPASNVTLMNDVTFGLNQLRLGRGATLNIGNHTMTLNGPTSVIAANGARISGTGLLRLQPGTGIATIGSIFTGTYIDPPTEIVSGTVKACATVFGGKLTIDEGATLSLFGVGMKAEGDLLINGTLNSFSDAPGSLFKGNTLTNNGTVTGRVGMVFGESDRQYVQKLAGAGLWTNPILFIDGNSTTTLLSDVTYDGDNMFVDGRLNTGAFTLALPCTVVWSGNGDAVGNVRRTNLTACPGAAIAYGNPFTSIQFSSGTSPTEMTVNIALNSPPSFPNAISRAYNISHVGGSSDRATLRLHYADSDLNGNNESNLQLWSMSGATWTSQASLARDATKNWVEAGGVIPLSSWTLGTSVPVPTPTPTPTPSPTPTPAQNIIEFSASSYSVSEDCTTVTITVNRIGDTSGAASVDYSTSDVTAGERRDYTTAPGKLRFAAGETAKSFAVLISEDSYVEGPESFNVTLSNPSGASLGASVATVQINDDPTEPTSNSIDDPATFVGEHYHDFLNRQADASGLAFWTDQITSCGTDQGCIQLKRINVSAAYFLSIEFQQTGYLVERIYKTAYGNASGTSTFGGTHQLPVPIVRFREFLRDTQQIGQGVVVGQAGWETVLENNKQAFTAEFVQLSRFTSAFPTSMTAAQLVDALNANAGNPLSAAERNQLVNDLSTNAKTRAQVLRTIAEHPNLVTAESNRAFVLMQYFGYLRRNPNDPQDADYTGYDFWLSKLNQFNGNFINAEMVKAFITSTEYRGRFGQ